jgi:hypothetical protein
VFEAVEGVKAVVEFQIPNFDIDIISAIQLAAFNPN